MPSIRPQDRISLCRYSYADERRCRTPRSPGHAHFCYFHARRESQSIAVDKLAVNLEYFFSGRYTSANDLCAAMGVLIPAVVRGDIKPRTASTLAYLAQTFIQAIQIAQKEYIYAFGTPEWGEQIRNNVEGNVDHLDKINAAEQQEKEEQPDQYDQPENGKLREPYEDATASAENTPLVGAQHAAPHLGENQAPKCIGDLRAAQAGSSDRCSCSGESSDSDEDPSIPRIPSRLLNP